MDAEIRMMASFTNTRPRFPSARALAVVLAVLGVPAGAFSGQWLQDEREVPLHPTIIMVDYQGKSYPVMAASAEFPEIVVEGKMKRLISVQNYQTPRAVGFGGGYVTFKQEHASSETRTLERRIRGGMNDGAKVSGGTLSSSGAYESTLISTGALSSCYLAVVFFQQDAAGLPLTGTTAIAFRQIGDLAAGRETKVAIDSAYVAPAGVHCGYFPMVFSRGVEVRTNQSDNAARYFRIGEMATHAALLEHYRRENPASDRPAAAYLRFQPELPAGVDPRGLPSTINAKFAVTETGEVDDVELDKGLDATVDRDIRRALNGWLFLPRLKKGYPVRSMIAVPLSFEKASS